MIDSLSIWKTTFQTLPKTEDTSWAGNFADWTDERVSGKAELLFITNPSTTFTFSKSTFQSLLLGLSPTPSAAAGIQGFADAWETAILASTLNIGPGAFVGIDSPATKWSVVSSSLIDPPSILLGKAKILELVSAAPAEDAALSEFPEKFRDAFLALTGSVIGLDSTPIPAGPLPLTSLFTSFE